MWSTQPRHLEFSRKGAEERRAFLLKHGHNGLGPATRRHPRGDLRRSHAPRRKHLGAPSSFLLDGHGPAKRLLEDRINREGTLLEGFLPFDEFEGVPEGPAPDGLALKAGLNPSGSGDEETKA